MPRRPIVTLLTDFGQADAYAAQMKGVLLSLLPTVEVVDITHQVPRGDVLAGAFALRQALPYFPAGTVHCVVVDPGVGTDRRILAACYAGQTVVCPDNGVITFVDEDQPLETISVVRNDQYFLPGPVSSTFHGRDIMAPVAARVAAGLSVDKLGPPAEKFKLLDLPAPSAGEDGSLAGTVLHVDGFGNLISNISAAMLERITGDLLGWEVRCADRSVGALLSGYAVADPGEPLALVNSLGLVEVAVNAGRACDVLGAAVGARIDVIPPQASGRRTRRLPE